LAQIFPQSANRLPLQVAVAGLVLPAAVVGGVADMLAGGANGQGLMPAYRWPIPPADRWAIVAHVRQMQQQRQAEGGRR